MENIAHKISISLDMDLCVAKIYFENKNEVFDAHIPRVITPLLIHMTAISSWNSV